MKSYIKLPEIGPMPDSRNELRKLSDDIWKKYVFFFILKYYKEVNKTEVVAIIENEKKQKREEIEKALKKHIYRWLNNNRLFNLHEFILNLEPSTECNNEGFIDLKFEHSQWRDKLLQRKHFSFEAKNLGKTKSMSLQKSIKEYVYIKEKNREDGGMFRFMTGKYACDINFGGMLGFVVVQTKMNVVKSLTDEIELIYDNSEVGKLSGKKVVLKSIEGNENTFETFHTRESYTTKEEEEFRLYHIIMDFVKQN
ncbi:MAG: hypothetical protein K8S16_01640 [Bacteroidales bacterium]|nr:hypothetical protein [Bacteroidales bacterium]